MTVLFAVIAIAFLMVSQALIVAAIGMLFFDFGFIDSWDAAWDHPFLLFFLPVISMMLRGSN